MQREELPLNTLEMDSFRDTTVAIANRLFSGYTDKQKRDNVRFIHGMTILFLSLFFLFAPSRSWARLVSFAIYMLFIILYIVLGDCWVYHVEKEFFEVEEDGGILAPLRDLLGLPHDPMTSRVFTSLGYFFAFFIGSCILLRDSFGIY